MQMRTFMAKEAEIQKQWFVIDAAGQRLGRLATKVASVLRGKHKPIFTPHVDTGDYVIVINADKVVLTGNKLDGKIYYRHTEYPGGIIGVPAREMLAKHPEKAIELAVWGMLPHNVLGRSQYRKLKVYAGAEHPHEAQQPVALAVEGR